MRGQAPAFPPAHSAFLLGGRFWGRTPGSGGEGGLAQCQRGPLGPEGRHTRPLKAQLRQEPVSGKRALCRLPLHLSEGGPAPRGGALRRERGSAPPAKVNLSCPCLPVLLAPDPTHQCSARGATHPRWLPTACNTPVPSGPNLGLVCRVEAEGAPGACTQQARAVSPGGVKGPRVWRPTAAISWRGRSHPVTRARLNDIAKFF